MKKITKKEGIKILMSHASKQVLNSWSILKEAMAIVDAVPKENYISILNSNPSRIGIKGNDKHIIFKVENGDNSTLGDLTKTDWYIKEVHGTKMVIVDFNGKGEKTVLGYTVL